MQLLAKVLNDKIDLIVSHDLLFLLPFATQRRGQLQLEDWPRRPTVLHGSNSLGTKKLIVGVRNRPLVY